MIIHLWSNIIMMPLDSYHVGLRSLLMILVIIHCLVQMRYKQFNRKPFCSCYKMSMSQLSAFKTFFSFLIRDILLFKNSFCLIFIHELLISFRLVCKSLIVHFAIHRSSILIFYKNIGNQPKLRFKFKIIWRFS